MLVIIITASPMGIWHKDETKVRCHDVSFSYLMLRQKLEDLFNNFKDPSSDIVNPNSLFKTI